MHKDNAHIVLKLADNGQIVVNVCLKRNRIVSMNTFIINKALSISSIFFYFQNYIF